MAPLNSPGKWDIFISHTQHNPNAVILAEKLNHSFEKLGRTVWLDVNMQHRDEAAMEEGVKNSASVIAIITDGDGQSGCAYFERPFCLKELRWAVEAGKYIQPVIRVEDKKRIGEFMKGAPKDLHFLGSVDFIDLHRGAIQYWDTGVSMIFQRIDNAPKNASRSSSSLNTEVHSFLNEIGLSQFADKFAELGVSTLEDLQDVDKDMLATDVGLNKLQINKFARNYANADGRFQPPPFPFLAHEVEGEAVPQLAPAPQTQPQQQQQQQAQQPQYAAIPQQQQQQQQQAAPAYNAAPAATAYQQPQQTASYNQQATSFPQQQAPMQQQVAPSQFVPQAAAYHAAPAPSAYIPQQPMAQQGQQPHAPPVSGQGMFTPQQFTPNIPAQPQEQPRGMFTPQQFTPKIPAQPRSSPRACTPPSTSRQTFRRSPQEQPQGMFTPQQFTPKIPAQPQEQPRACTPRRAGAKTFRRRSPRSSPGHVHPAAVHAKHSGAAPGAAQGMFTPQQFTPNIPAQPQEQPQAQQQPGAAYNAQPAAMQPASQPTAMQPALQPTQFQPQQTTQFQPQQTTQFQPQQFMGGAQTPQYQPQPQFATPSMGSWASGIMGSQMQQQAAPKAAEPVREQVPTGPPPTVSVDNVDTSAVKEELKPIVASSPSFSDRVQRCSGAPGDGCLARVVGGCCGSRVHANRGGGMLQAGSKKCESDDNSKRLGTLFFKLNLGDISDSVSAKLLQLCAAVDRQDYATATQLQVGLTISDWDQCCQWLTALKRLIKTRQGMN
ncbi:hypothetical protein CYMTET_51221 [Cymbomonas tetramitiformis]|uniref:TIR domain-containing protein n=1 Tax=Cymbomonas tetramitiformis TaxID=36881 RepID=A0AAE0BLN9_9CHLO|nr:hypothetical protein CYMTET_51221 [Cymbomonas tetramitiformis]